MRFEYRRWILAYCRFCIAFVLILVCAGNITNSFLLKWNFRDVHGIAPEPGIGLLDMMEGRSPKPFVYRALLPQAMKHFAENLPPQRLDSIYRAITRLDSLHHAYFSKIPSQDWTPVSALVFHMMYLLIVIAMILILWLIFRLARLHGLTYAEALGAVVGFGFLYPLTFQCGGYFYDFLELAGAMLALYGFLKNRMVFATLVMTIASLNKETFFLFPIALYALHPPERSLRLRLAWTALQTVLCLLMRHWIMSGHEQNPGGIVEFHLWDNLRYWLSLEPYFSFTNLVGKGILTPSLENPLLLIPLAVYFHACWQGTTVAHKRFVQISIAMLAPLLPLFGYQDEFRNLSLAFPAIVLMAMRGIGEFSRIFAPTANDAAPG